MVDYLLYMVPQSINKNPAAGILYRLRDLALVSC
jgi:hypothetical protein